MAHFMSISELKEMFNVPASSKIEILVDKVTGNKSFIIDGTWMRVSKTLDTSLPVIFHTDKYDEETGEPDWLQGVLSNVTNAKKEVFGYVG